MRSVSKSIVKGTFFMLIGKSVRIGSFFLLYIIIGRSFGASALGTFTLAFSIFQFLEIFANFGLYNTIVRFTPEYLAGQKTGKLRSLFTTATTSSLLISTLCTAAVILLGPLLEKLFKDPNLANTANVLILGLPFLALSKIFIAFMTSYEDTKAEATIDNIIFPIISISILAWTTIKGYAPGLIPYSLLTAYIVSMLISTFLLFRKKEFRNAANDPENRFNKDYLFYSFPIFLNTVFFFLIKTLDTFFLGYFNSKADVGVYNASLNIAVVPSIFLTSVNTIYFPTISRLIAERNMPSVKKTYTNVIRVLTFLTLPISVFTVVYANEILSLFGSGFMIPTLLMLILVLGSFANMFTGPIGFTLNALDKQKLIAVNSIISIATAILLNILLVPRYGLIGAGVANASAMFVQNVLGVVQFYILTKHTPYTLKLVFTVLVCAAAGAFLFLLKEKLPILQIESLAFIWRVGKLAIIGGIYYLICAALIWIIRLYEVDDLEILSAFKRRTSATN